MIRTQAAWTAIALLTGIATAEPNTMPAARVHARMINGKPMKFTSKLKRVIELNFTLGFNHAESKPIISQYIGRVAVDYAGAGKDSAFSIRKFMGPSNGTSVGLPNPVPALDDLLSGEVIIDNNVSFMNQLPGKNAAFAAAFETAVKVHGRGVVGFHGSGDGGKGWTFYTNELHPLDYHSMGFRTPAPVYVNDAEAKHIVNEGILATGTEMSVPMGTDASGAEIKRTVTTRPMRNEWYRFGRSLLADPATQDRVTCFLRYDPAATDLPAQYRYPGGNPLAWQIKIGAGKAFYMLPGHAADELTTGSSFDGGTGDFEKYFAQVLFYMAGYDTTACRSDCDGLPVVDDQNRLTGQTVGGTTVVFDPDRMSFIPGSSKPYIAKLVDVTGKVVASKTGTGMGRVEFDRSRLAPGIYLLSVKSGNLAAGVRRYLVSPVMR